MFVQHSEPRWIYFVVVPVLCFLVLFSFNSSRDLAGVKAEEEVLHPFKPSVFVINPLQTSEVSLIKSLAENKIDQFRGDAKNTAYYKVGFSLEKVKLIQKTQTEQNASTTFKAATAPIKSDKFVILTSSDGEVSVLNKTDYSLHWKFNLQGEKEKFRSTPIAFLNYAILTSLSGKAYFINLEKRSIISSIEIGTSINTSPVYSKGSVYINSDSDLKNNFILKWDLLGNKVSWTSDYINSGSLSSPALGEEALFFGDNQGYFYSILKSSGKTKWVKKYDRSITSAPVIHGSKVLFVTSGGNLVALDQATGAEAWKYKIEEKSLSELAIHPVLGAAVIRSSEALYKFNIETGLRTSRLKMSFPDNSSPIILENYEELHIFTACRLLEICMFKYKGPQLMRLFTLKSDIVNQVSVDTNARLLVVSKETGALSVIKKPVPRVNFKKAADQSTSL